MVERETFKKPGESNPPVRECDLRIQLRSTPVDGHLSIPPYAWPDPEWHFRKKGCYLDIFC
jgi:hypothetical protein